MRVGGLKMEIGFLVDGLTAMMMVVVTFVSLMVHIYTIGYMADDPGYQRFFCYISLFTFSMLMLVMSNNFLQLFFGWEAVGLVSYLLIGFWYTRPTAIFANLKAFLVNRVGDFGFILGIGLIVAFAGTLELRARRSPRAASSRKLTFPGSDWMLITVICICLFIGAMGKSAQFPLHVWLPDSMEGPTPISALIHAATMVTAGIFMVARMSPLFELSDTALSFVLVIGAITALFMGFLGIIQNDIKRVVAYSTLSQLGYMTVALGASAYSVAVFHLMTHAFFKALLFLAAGSVIIGMHHDQDIRNMGGLRKYMPITWITSLLGSLALIGTPLFAGFYSKDSIIEAVHASHLPGAGFAYFAVAAGVFVTAFYSFRMYFLVFHGPERFRDKPFPPPAHDHDAHDAPDGHGADAHATHAEPDPHAADAHATRRTSRRGSSRCRWSLLAIPSVVIGCMTIGPMLFGDFFKDSIAVLAERHPAMEELAKRVPRRRSRWPARADRRRLLARARRRRRSPGSSTCSSPTSRPRSSARFALRLPAARQQVLHGLVQRERARAAPRASPARGLWKGGDVGLIDGILIDGSARTVGGIAALSRRAAERLPLLVCAGDDRRRDRPDDLAALAVPRRPVRPLSAHRRTTRTWAC